jgi:hypothetical protein
MRVSPDRSAEEVFVGVFRVIAPGGYNIKSLAILDEFIKRVMELLG